MKKLLLAAIAAGMLSTSAFAVSQTLKVNEVWIEGTTTYVVGNLTSDNTRFKCSVSGDADTQKNIVATALTAKTSGDNARFFLDWSSGSCVMSGIIIE